LAEAEGAAALWLDVLAGLKNQQICSCRQKVATLAERSHHEAEFA
jgi:hypothetical protein